MAEKRTSKCSEALQHSPASGPEGRCEWCGKLIAGLIDRDQAEREPKRYREDFEAGFLQEMRAAARAREERTGGAMFLSAVASLEECAQCGQPLEACECSP